MKNYSIGSTLRNQFLPRNNPQNPAKTGMVCAWRTLDENNKLIRSVGSTPQPNLYKAFKMGAYTDGLSALIALRAMGFQYTLGLSFDTTFVAPDEVITDNASGLVTLIWNTPSMGIENLISNNPTGSVTQGSTASGTIRGVNIVANQSQMTIVPVSGSTAFNTSEVLDVSATLSNAGPNPATSDNVCIAVWGYYNQYITNRKFTTSPDLWVSVAIEGRDTDITPADTPITLVAPTSVTELPDGSFNLYFPITANNLGLLPTTYLNSSTISQTIIFPDDGTQTVYYANGVYLRGSAGTAGADYSLDGSNWSICTNLTSILVNKFHWNGSLYVAATNDGLWYSVNGILWTQSATDSGTFTDVSYANTKWVAASTVGLFYSSNGTTWTACTGDDDASFTALTSGTGTDGFRWVAVTAGDDAYSSEDGITFAALTVSTDGFYSAAFSDGVFQLGGNTTGIVYSTDGDTYLASSLTTLSVYDIQYIPDLDLWVAGTSVGIYSSSNGITWTVATSVIGQTGVFREFAYGADRLVVVSSSGIFNSADGLTWVASTGSGGTGDYSSIVFGEIFVGGDTGGLSNSADGLVWVTDNTDATAIYNGYTLSSTQLILNASSPTADFTTGSTITVTLDTATSGFSFIDNEEISSFCIARNIPAYATLTALYPAFVAGVTANQAPGAVANSKFNVQGYFGYAFTIPNEVVLSTMIAPDSTGWVGSATLDVPTIYQYPAIGYVNAMQHMFMDLSNEDPYYDDSGKSILMNQQASTNLATYPKIEAANQLTGQGWTVFMPSNTGLRYVFRNVNCMQTNGGVEDGEYRYQSVQLKVRWLDKNIVQVGDATCVRPDGSRDNNNPELVLRLNANLQNVLTVGQDNGMLGDGGTIEVSLSETDVTRFDVVATTSVVSTNSGIDYVVIARPYTI